MQHLDQRRRDQMVRCANPFEDLAVLAARGDPPNEARLCRALAATAAHLPVRVAVVRAGGDALTTGDVERVEVGTVSR
jgi:hypothetical protein